MNKQPVIICIMGPTASGKTSLALEIAAHLPVEIISVDSALVYREMNVGTSKPDHAMLSQVPHHLIDICDPVEAYSVAQFRLDALYHIEQIIQRQRIPLLVGGTMLYFRGLLNGLSDLPSADQATREQLEKAMLEVGPQGLHDRLKAIDPVAAKKIHPNDPQRIQRALEVYEVTGLPISEWWARQSAKQIPYQVIKLATMPDDRKQLHKQIEQRFDEMLAQGFVAEVEQLKSRGDLDLDKPSMRSVGYRQIWQYLDAEFDYATMREKGIAATRQLAKRQLTWLRREPELHWMTTGNATVVKDALLKINTVIQ